MGGRGILPRADAVARSLRTAHAGRPAGRALASAVELLAGGTVLSLLALSLGDLDPARWSDVSSTAALGRRVRRSGLVLSAVALDLRGR